MKNYLLFLLILIFTGCSQKEIIYEFPKPTFKQEDYKATEKAEEIPTIDVESKIIIEHFKETKKRLAIIFPSKIVSKYANSVVNSVATQLLLENNGFELEVINTYDESSENIQKALDELTQKDFENVIMLFTASALRTLENAEDIENFKIYFPLINKNESPYFLTDAVAGGVDYEQQVEKLLFYSNGKNTMFSSESPLGSKLQYIVNQQIPNLYLDATIESEQNSFQNIASRNILNDSSLFLNTSIVKTSIILSQLRVHNTTPYIMLSTQLNYTPLIISLTQYQDRENLLTASSIEEVDKDIEEIAALFNADLVYNWVNFSSLIGANYLLGNNNFPYNDIVDNQVQYRTLIYKNTAFGFELLQ